MMKKTLPAKIFVFALVAALLLVEQSYARQAQNSEPAVRRNSPYSPNPKRKNPPPAPPQTSTVETKAEANNLKSAATDSPKKSANQPPGTTAEAPPKAETENKPEPDAPKAENAQFQNTDFESRSVAKKTFDVARRAAASGATAAPTEIYKVGAGDVLFISLQNAPAKESSYFTVLKDGTIDYPLAGEMVSVLGLTTEEIQNVLQEKIKLYENPQVAVKVREPNSHAYTVIGMVEKAGEKYMHREAVPLFVVRAESIAQAKANRAVIKRAGSGAETLDLRDPKSDDVLIFPGDIVEFDSAEAGNAFGGHPQFYYIGGQVVSGGQKDFYKGITLTQAILVAGGLKKSGVKTVVIRRKNDSGLLVPLPFDLKAIKDGKTVDPQLEAGDTIEIGN